MLELDFSLSRYPAISIQSPEIVILKSDSKSATYENRTKNAKCGGSETNGQQERISTPDGVSAVRRFMREGPSLLAIFARSYASGRVLPAVELAERERLPANPLRICSNNLA
jgi:hypothetical protein